MIVPGRETFEKMLARILGKKQQTLIEDIMREVGDEPSRTGLGQGFWQDVRKEFTAALMPVMLNIFLSQAEEINAATPELGVSWDLVNEAAADWAQRYTYDLVKNITETEEKLLQQAVSNYYDTGQNLDDLKTELSRYFSPVRAEMIAITETTRAATEGERAYMEALESESGIRMVPLWATATDEAVCPECGSRDGEPVTDGVYPPAHPNCRCWIEWDFPKEAA